MPGEMITAAGPGLWPLVEIEGLLTGVGTPFTITPPGIGGLLARRVKAADVSLDGADGAYGSIDFEDVKVITVPYEIGTQETLTQAEALLAFLELGEAWAPQAVDIELHIQLPGIGHVYVVGRPRGLDDDLADVESGVCAGFATFHALEPAVITVGS